MNPKSHVTFGIHFINWKFQIPLSCLSLALPYHRTHIVRKPISDWG